ncbi:MAG TPA: hypothetical protein VG714_08625, partial [Acidobacteriaceae bacterium]|nr:hypothetical protein [Acidobacteriaceae bacterium]
MATTPNIADRAPMATAPEPGPGPGLLVSLSPHAPESLTPMLGRLAEAFPAQTVLVATPDPAPANAAPAANIQVLPYAPPAPASSSWLLTAADFLNTYKLAGEHNASACLLLGPEAHTLTPEAIRGLANAVLMQKADLAMPHYELTPHDGLVNSAILYPVSRALFAARPRFPLAVDLAYSMRMAERLAAC